MSAATIRSAGNVSYINEDHPTRMGEAVIFINGAHNKEHEARRSAAQISSLVGDRRVVLFYNPTLSLEGQVIGIQELEKWFSRLILDEYSHCVRDLEGNVEAKIRVLILAHSHGAVVLAKSMENAEIQGIKGHIEIATFGGVQLIANPACRKVQNFINETDIFSMMAQIEIDNPDGHWLEGALGELQRMFVSGLLASSAHQNPEFAKRIRSALKTQEKIKRGVDPLSAQIAILTENVVGLMQKEETQGDDQSHLIDGVVEVLCLELRYNVQILQPIASRGIDHSVETYYPKIRDVIDQLF